MVPCPWALHAVEWLRENPDVSFGVHLTVICDTTNYKWSPLTPKEKVPSLIDESGYCYSLDRMSEFVAQADLGELELEFRAQIEAVLAAGLKPAHLDWHCLHSGGRADIFDLTFGLAREYGLALRVADQPFIDQVQGLKLPTDDYTLLDSYDLDPAEKPERYHRLLRELPAGLTEWAVHPGFGNDELQAIEPDSWQVRQTDYDFLMSQEAKDIIAQEGIVLIEEHKQSDKSQTRNSHAGEEKVAWKKPDPRDAVRHSQAPERGGGERVAKQDKREDVQEHPYVSCRMYETEDDDDKNKCGCRPRYVIKHMIHSGPPPPFLVLQAGRASSRDGPRREGDREDRFAVSIKQFLFIDDILADPSLRVASCMICWQVD